MNVKHCDVAIVGAGPAGSATAITLARRRYSVVLLDREKFPREKLCGDFINPSSWPTLAQLGVAQPILAATPERVTRFRITSHLGAEAEVPLGMQDGEPVFGVALRRATLDALLLSRAQSEGAMALEPCKVKSLQRVSMGWSAIGDTPEGECEIRAKVVIGADGRNSWVAHRQGMAQSSAERGRAVGFQFLVTSRHDVAGRVEIHLFPGGYVGLLGLGRGLVNFCFAVDKSCLEQHGSLDRLLSSSVRQDPDLNELLGQSERVSAVRSTYPVYFPPRRCYGDALLLVGDAARVSEPVTGEGIYFALRSGLLAGNAVHAGFCEGNLTATSLRRYAQACQRAFALRRGLNAAIRYLMYRPRLLTQFVRFSAKQQRLLDGVVHTLCLPEEQRARESV
ncbi:MAG: NAD(P)/FAD-dependent oxidoreductase [Deltaproteobacteria bacterium]|nr:NAD(P)/FAD-dependent oxidoreductase [Deltaproteobacteria bacterium]